MQKVHLGITVMTSGIKETIQEGKLTDRDIQSILSKHANGDWGDLEEEDKQANEEALKNRIERIFSMYKIRGIKLYVITEWDRSVTTVLLPEEY